ncbi:MAG: hypothetical protein AAFO01_10730 [Pseudomonadota bacterium]
MGKHWQDVFCDEGRADCVDAIDLIQRCGIKGASGLLRAKTLAIMQNAGCDDHQV